MVGYEATEALMMHLLFEQGICVPEYLYRRYGSKVSAAFRIVQAMEDNTLAMTSVCRSFLHR